jgi:hypothetical protein
MTLSEGQLVNFCRRVRVPDGRLGRWGCWIWTGEKTTKGYGRFVFMREGKIRRVRAHRAMWQLAYGPIPEGMLVLHRCDRPLCVKPAHLYLGSPLDNTRDMLSRGRAGGTLPPHGKLTEEKAQEIRRMCAERHTTQRKIANAYGVSEALISQIVNRRVWKAA